MRLIVKIVLMLLIVNNIGISQVYLEWASRYNGGFGYDAGFAVTTDDSSYVYVTGYSYRTASRRDLIVLKYSPSGGTQWVKRFSEHSIDLAGNSIHVGKDNSLYVTGSKTYKLNLAGDSLWGNNANGLSVIDDICNIYLAGGTGTQFRTRKYTSEGIFLWEKLYQYQNYIYNVPRDITLDNENNVLVTGQSDQTGTTYAFATLKYSSDGAEIWIRRHNEGLSAYAFAVACDSSNNVYVTGRLQSNTIDILTIKYSPSGDTLWKKVFDSGGGDAGYDIAVDLPGNVYIAGLTAGGNYITIKYNTEGNFLWSKVQLYGDVLDVTKPKIELDANRNVYMAFKTKRVNNNHTNYAVVKYNNDGIQQWMAEYNNNENSFENTIYDLAVDKDANVYMTGQSGISIATVKFAQGITSINPVPGSTPADFQLEQNYPNPFNPETVINYRLPVSSYVSLKVYNVMGREIKMLVNERQNAGSYTVVLDGSDLPSGVYFYRLSSGDYNEVRKMVLLR